MRKGTKVGARKSSDLELVMQGYVITAVISTSGLDVLLMATIFFLGFATLREVVRRVVALSIAAIVNQSRQPVSGVRSPLLQADRHSDF